MSAYQFSILRPITVADSGTFTRSTTGMYYAKTGYRTSAAINVPRFTYDPTTLAPAGLMNEAAATNLALWSDDLTQAVWTKNSVTAAAASGLGADNATSLSLLSCAAATAAHYASQSFTGLTPNITRSFSVDVKSFGSGNATHVQVFVDDTTAANGTLLNVRLADGAITRAMTNFGTAAGVSVKVKQLQNGVYRLTVTTKINSSSIRVGAILLDNANAATSSFGPSFSAATTDKMYVGAAQYEDGTSDTSYFPTTTVALARGADVNTQVMTSNVVEVAGTSDPIAWVSAMAITAGTQVSRIVAGGIHSIYQRVTAGPANTTPPESDTVNWVYVGPTNRWRIFDTANETQTTNTDDIQMVLKPGVMCDGLMFDNLDADSIRVFVEGSTYDQTVTLKTRACSNWFQYFFEPFSFRKTAVFTGLPLVTTNIIHVIIRKAALTAKAGTCVPGFSRVIGYAEPGAQVGIIDYSTKNTDQFGSTTVIKRSYSKRMDISVIVQNSDIDSVQELLASYRSTPVAWIGAGNLYSSLLVYGYYKSFDIGIVYPTQSRCTLQIEGLT